MGIVSIIVAIVLFSIIIFVHEFGHFIVAKACGIRVNEFAIGMGPKLFSFGKKETVYSLRLFPIGGFCAMEGEDDASDDPKAFGNKNVWKRIAVVVAGVAMNFLLGFLVLLVAIGAFLPLSNDGALIPTMTIAHLDESSTLYQSGLRAGDTICSVDGRAILTSVDLSIMLQSDEDGVMSMKVKRDGKKVVLPAVKFDLIETEDGVRVLKYEFTLYGKPQNPLNMIVYAAKTECSLVTSVWGSLGDIVTGKYGLNDLSGPVGTVDIIGDMVGQAAKTVSREDIYSVLSMFALISVNIGVMNLLPIPALDGGRLMFLLFEAIFRRPVPQKFEGLVHAIGFALLMVLMVVLVFNDVFRLITGG
ncbi:MAG: RIP metalloprotease RseP [Clostridia bacterium]|nr:RIP metalloprotease RseP [Clostridia bacterium]